MSGVTSALVGMSTATTVVVVVVVAVVVILVVVAVTAMSRQRRHARLRSAFGAEYDVAVDDARSRGAAERDLEGRIERHETLPLRPLSPERQSQYRTSWEQLQARFVDRPQHAVAEADELIRAAMIERGYPAQSFEQQVSDLSVEHGAALEDYRQAHALATKAPDDQTTEDLRRAIVGYRRLFEDIVGVPAGAPTGAVPAEPSSAGAAMTDDLDLRERDLRAEEPPVQPRRD